MRVGVRIADQVDAFQVDRDVAEHLLAIRRGQAGGAHDHETHALEVILPGDGLGDAVGAVAEELLLELGDVRGGDLRADPLVSLHRLGEGVEVGVADVVADVDPASLLELLEDRNLAGFLGLLGLILLDPNRLVPVVEGHVADGLARRGYLEGNLGDRQHGCRDAVQDRGVPASGGHLDRRGDDDLAASDRVDRGRAHGELVGGLDAVGDNAGGAHGNPEFHAVHRGGLASVEAGAGAGGERGPFLGDAVLELGGRHLAGHELVIAAPLEEVHGHGVLELRGERLGAVQAHLLDHFPHRREDDLVLAHGGAWGRAGGDGLALPAHDIVDRHPSELDLVVLGVARVGVVVASPFGATDHLKESCGGGVGVNALGRGDGWAAGTATGTQRLDVPVLIGQGEVQAELGRVLVDPGDDLGRRMLERLAVVGQVSSFAVVVLGVAGRSDPLAGSFRRAVLGQGFIPEDGLALNRAGARENPEAFRDARRCALDHRCDARGELGLHVGDVGVAPGGDEAVDQEGRGDRVDGAIGASDGCAGSDRLARECGRDLGGEVLLLDALLVGGVLALEIALVLVDQRLGGREGALAIERIALGLLGDIGEQAVEERALGHGVEADGVTLGQELVELAAGVGVAPVLPDEASDLAGDDGGSAGERLANLGGVDDAIASVGDEGLRVVVQGRVVLGLLGSGGLFGVRLALGFAL